MTNGLSIVQRAYDLAGSGEHKTISDVRLALSQEGFTQADIAITLAAASLARDLRRLCKEAQAPAAG